MFLNILQFLTVPTLPKTDFKTQTKIKGFSDENVKQYSSNEKLWEAKPLFLVMFKLK